LRSRRPWRLERQNPVQLPFQAATVFQPGAGLQRVPATGEQDRAQQQRLQARGEDGVARLDGVAQVAQLVRQADLPQVGVAALGAVEVGHPDLRPVPAQHLVHHGPAAGRPDHVNDHLVVPEHPVPVRPAADAHRGLVGADHPGTP